MYMYMYMYVSLSLSIYMTDEGGSCEFVDV